MAFIFFQILMTVALGGLAEDYFPPGSPEEAISDPSHPQPRKESLRSWSVGTGPFWQSQLGASEVLYGFSVNHHWEVNPNAEIQARFFLATAFSAITSASTSVGAFYFLAPSNTSPFVGGDFGLGLMMGDRVEDKAGFTGGAFGGVRFFRESDTQLEVAARYTLLLSRSSGSFPGIYGLTVGLLF